MANILYLNQFITTQLSVVGGINSSVTTSIVVQSVSGIDTTKPGIACFTYADPLDLDVAEFVEYSSINSTTKTLQGVVRGAEGYSAKSHLNNAVVAFPVSESHINRIAEKLNGNDTLDNDLDLGSGINIKSAGNDPYRTISLIPGALKPTTTGGCASVATDEAATNDVDYNNLAFDSSSTESAFIVLQMPDSWDAGAIQYRYTWLDATGTTSEGVVMSLAGRSYADGDAIDQAAGTAITNSDTHGAGGVRTSGWSGDVTLAGTPAAGELVYLKASRSPGETADTLGEDMLLLGLQIRYRQGQHSD